MTAPLIGVGIPTWRGVGFVAQTLESVLKQTGVRFKVVVSIDGADSDTERACLTFASDPKVQIVVQPQRLGWVKNTAAVLASASEQAEFVCVQPHDDWIEADYLATLVDAAGRHPDAAVVFTDLTAFGAHQGIISQESVIGTPCERQLSLLSSHYNAVAYRGLIRTSALKTVPMLSGNDWGDFACDTVWMARLARVGNLVRVPRVLYHKRYHANSAHAEWTTRRGWQKAAAWTQHCLDMLAEALSVATTINQRRQLIDVARGRLCLNRTELGPYAGYIKGLSPIGRWAMRAAFEARAATRSNIGPLWSLLDRP
jgi:GT2 family glycosyltransferase